MRTLPAPACLQSTHTSAHGLYVPAWRIQPDHCTHRHRAVRGRPGVSLAVNNDISSAPATAAAAAAPDPGLDSFKALIGERRFTCTQCGKCCTGAGEVWVSEAEAANIARYLKLPLARFLAQHCHAYSKVEGFRLLRSNMESETRDCTFLRPDNTCAIHPVRPLQCSTYPWWPELMNDREWQLEKAEICEGFDHPDAPPTDLDAAAQQLKLATIQEYQKRLAYKPSRKQSKKAAAAAKQQAANTTSSSSTEGEEAGRAFIEVSSSGTSSSSSSSDSNWQERIEQLQAMLDEGGGEKQ